MINSKCVETGVIDLPFVNGEFSMVPFDLNTLDGLTDKFKAIAKQMLGGIKHNGGIAYLTVHGKYLQKSETLRRGGPHTDGNYEPYNMSFGGGGGNGWKIGENGPAINTDMHKRQYNTEKGGLILATNYASCLGWNGKYDGLPKVGGDCSHIELDEPILLQSNKVYYANNHFVHESIPVGKNVHRVFARITMPETHEFN